MFTLGIIGLVAAYLLTVLLLLSINLYSNLSWRVKAAAIAVAALFYIVSYHSIPPLLGWPTSADLPPRFRLVAVEARQPDKQSGEKGAIFLWVRDLEDLSAQVKPRAYELPYTDHLFEATLKAKAKMERGMQQLGEFKRPEDGAVRLRTDLKRTAQQASRIEFYDLPDPLIPEK